MLTALFVTSITFATEDILVPPDNDLIENAINLNFGPSPYLESDVNFPEATTTNDQTFPGNGCSLTQAAVWYKFTATKAGNVAAGILNPDGAVVVFFSGPENATNGQNLIFVDQSNNICGNSPLGNINTTAGTTYYLYMRNAITSDVSINVSAAFKAPDNDLISNATNLNGEINFSEVVHFLNATNTDDGGQIDCPSNELIGIWYKFTADIDGEALIGSNLPIQNSALIFYSAENENATTGADVTHVDQPTNPCNVGNLASINAVAGTTYYIFAVTDLPYVEITVNLSGVLGTADNQLNGFDFYPNPVTNEINLSASTILNEVSIYNVSGQKVYAEDVNATKKSIDLSALTAGLYILNVSSEGKNANFKIIKE